MLATAKYLLFLSHINILFLILLLIIGAVPVASADVILTAPPRETEEAGKKVYDPLARYLSSITGKKVVYAHPANWRDYEKNMKNDVYDIIFDGPHFAAWRINSLHARPIAKLPGSLRFVLIVPRVNSYLKTPSQLVGQKICTLPSPNLGALTLFSMFPYPARQPTYHLVKGGFKAVAKSMQSGHCNAAILRSTFYYKRASTEFRNKTRVIRRSVAMTNQGITASKRINNALLRKIIKSLAKTSGKRATKPILDRFSNNAVSFIPSKRSDYINQNLLVDTAVFGW